jgi:hypothetical protein
MQAETKNTHTHTKHKTNNTAPCRQHRIPESQNKNTVLFIYIIILLSTFVIWLVHWASV